MAWKSCATKKIFVFRFDPMYLPPSTRREIHQIPVEPYFSYVKECKALIAEVNKGVGGDKASGLSSSFMVLEMSSDIFLTNGEVSALFEFCVHLRTGLLFVRS
jgi:hypothetical protein